MVFLYPFVNWSKSLPFKLLEIEVFNNRITMAETVNQENNPANETQEERTFTQSQLDAIIQAGCDPSSIVVDNIAGLISIHAPRAGVRRRYLHFDHVCRRISIHAPHAGCDHRRGRAAEACGISIHAPHAGFDCTHKCRSALSFYFNPRTPCGVRPLQAKSVVPSATISIHAPRAGAATALLSLGGFIL